MEESRQNKQAESNPGRLCRKKILAWAAGSLLALILISLLLALIGFGLFRYFYKRAPDPIVSYQVDKTVRAGIPSWVPVDVKAKETIPVRLSKVLEADIPFKQDVDIKVDDDFTVPLDVTVSVPIDQEIFVETDIPIKTEIPLEGSRVQTTLFGLKDVSLPLSGSFPVNMTIPFKGPVHVKTKADIRIQQDVTVHVDKQFTFPLDLTANVCLPIDDVFEVSLPENVSVNARVSKKIPVDVQLRVDVPKQDVFASD